MADWFGGVCGHGQYRRFDDAGVLIKTGADGLYLAKLPPAIDVLSSVGDESEWNARPCYHERGARQQRRQRWALLTVCECCCVVRGWCCLGLPLQTR